MKCLQLVIERDDVSGVLNVSSGEGHSIVEIFERVASHLGISGRQSDEVLPPAPDDIPTVVLDPSKTFAEIGWKVEVGFDETISSMLSWYDSYGVTDVFSHLQERR